MKQKSKNTESDHFCEFFKKKSSRKYDTGKEIFQILKSNVNEKHLLQTTNPHSFYFK